MLLNLPVAILKEIMRIIGINIYSLRELCVEFYHYIPMSQRYFFHISNTAHMLNFVDIYMTEGKQSTLYKDAVFNISVEYDVDHHMLYNIFKHVNIRNLFVNGGPGVLLIEHQDFVRELEVSRYKFPFAQTTLFKDMKVGQTYLRRVNTNKLVMRRCYLFDVGMYEIPLLNILELEITESMNISPIICRIPASLKVLNIDRTVFCEQLLFNICLSNVEHLTVPHYYDIVQYVQHFPNTLKTLCVTDCGVLINDTVRNILSSNSNIYITHIEDDKVIESVFPTRKIEAVSVNITQYTLTKGDVVMRIGY
jgi:hypothetical protein